MLNNPISVFKRRAAVLLCWSALLACPGAIWAQMFSYGTDREGPSQSVSVGYHRIDFEYKGDTEAAVRFDYTDPAVGLIYTRPNLYAAVLYGTSDAFDGTSDLRLIDVAFSTWGGLTIPGLSSTGKARLYAPIVLHSSYRRVEVGAGDNLPTDAFTFTVLGLGAGLGFTADVLPRVRFEARATPIIGLALRSFGDATGRATFLETDALVHLGQIAGRVGLTLGYSLRLQGWNVSASDLFPNIDDQLFDYGGNLHAFHAGINW